MSFSITNKSAKAAFANVYFAFFCKLRELIHQHLLAAQQANKKLHGF